jgi:hypothetical protein
MPTEREILEHIRREYDAMLRRSAVTHAHRPEVLAGIMARESAGGLSPLLNKQGPDGLGDKGHGHGLMQIDDRSYPAFCASEDWRNPARNIDMGALVLASKRRYIRERAYGRFLTTSELERASIAAYNCGQGRVMTCITANMDFDTYTAHRNYSKEVLRLAEAYRSLDATVTA